MFIYLFQMFFYLIFSFLMQALPPLPTPAAYMWEEPIDPTTFMCEAMYYYQITGDKDGFNDMLLHEVNDKLNTYYCYRLGYIIRPLFDINTSRTRPLFDRIFEAYDLLINHMSS